MPEFGGRPDKAWTLEKVKQDTWSAVYDMKKFMRIAENIKGGSA